MNEIKFLLKYVRKNKVKMILSLFCAMIFVSALCLIPLFCGKTVDQIDKVLKLEFASLNDSQFYFYLIGLFILIILSVSFQFIFDYLVNVSVEKLSKELKDDIFDKLNRLPISYIDTHSHGNLVSLVLNDTENVNNALVSSFKQLYQGSIQVILTLIVMFSLNWMLALVVTFLTPLSFFVSFTIAKGNSKYFKQQAKIVGELSGIAMETFNNIDIIKSFNYEEKSFDGYKELNDELYKCGQKAQFMSGLINPFTRLINYTVYATVGIIAAILSVLSTSTDNILFGASCTVGTIITFVQYSNQFAKPFNEISSCFSEIQSGLSSLSRIYKLFLEKDDIDDGKLECTSEIETISFNHLYFSYTQNQKLIEDFSLKLGKNMKIAIVGPTGCGKTTIINLLLRFYDPKSGSIDINNIPLVNFTKKSLRNNFIMVLQDTWIFNGTVKENITYGNPTASMDEIIEATKKANCYDFIMRLPKGFDTKINDTSGLSVGQKQLISIARVMLKYSPIVILDEATSNIDTRTEAKISEAFNLMMKGRTSFVIAHRLSTIINSDVIIVMKNGHIVETGRHEELLKRHGFYYELYNAQYANIWSFLQK